MVKKLSWWEACLKTIIYIFAEGQTEELFINKLLKPHFMNKNIVVKPLLFTTSPGHSGGFPQYSRAVKEVKHWCSKDKNNYITTMIDLYGLTDKNFSGYKEALKLGDPFKIAQQLERNFENSVNHNNFFANLIVHEFEGLLFSDLEAFTRCGFDQNCINKLKQNTESFQTPEHINNNKVTSPFNRIKTVFKSYRKITHSKVILDKIGLAKIRQECKHFNSWIERMEKLSPRA